MTMAKKTHGKTASGVPITEELVAELAEKAEVGYDVDEMLGRRGGRPPIGSAPASVESVRLDPCSSIGSRTISRTARSTTACTVRSAALPSGRSSPASSYGCGSP